MVDQESLFIAQVTKIIEKRESDMDWGFVLKTYGFDYLLERYTRLERSQYWQDEDYPWNIRHTLKDAYEDRQDDTLEMIHFILDNNLKIEDEDFIKYPWLKEFLERGGYTYYKPISGFKGNYLVIENVPHDFYRELIDLINKCYDYEIFSGVMVFSRKLLENLIIDILKNYHGSDIDKYYIQTQGRFHDFRTVLNNFEEIIDDLKPIEPSLDKKIIKEIGQYKDTANRKTHSLVVKVSENEIESHRSNLNHLVKLLIKIILEQRTHTKTSTRNTVGTPTIVQKQPVHKNKAKKRKTGDKQNLVSNLSSKKGFNIFINIIPSDTSKSYDLSMIEANNQISANLRPIYCGSWKNNYNFDGFLTYSGNTKEESDSYVQIFKNGVIEAVYTDNSSEIEYIDINWLEKLLINYIKLYSKALGDLGIPYPISILIIIKGVEGKKFITDSFRSILGKDIPIDRDILELPEVTINNFDDHITKYLKPVFDSLWNAGGYEKSNNYNENGEYMH